MLRSENALLMRSAFLTEPAQSALLILNFTIDCDLWDLGTFRIGGAFDCAMAARVRMCCTRRAGRSVENQSSLLQLVCRHYRYLFRETLMCRCAAVAHIRVCGT